MDADLTFQPLLSRALAKGWRSFLTLYHSAETGGFSVPVLSSQVPLRINPVVLYSAAFFAVVPGMAAKLDRLQWQ